jgi:hypothetical protein
MLESEERTTNNTQLSYKIRKKIQKLFQLLELIELINRNLSSNLVSYDIFNIKGMAEYLTYTLEQFSEIIENGLLSKEIYTYFGYNLPKVNDVLIPKFVNSISFNYYVFCEYNQGGDRAKRIREYLNMINNEYLYFSFDNFQTEYIDKLYKFGESYGGGLFKQLRNSIICTLKTFYTSNINSAIGGGIQFNNLSKSNDNNINIYRNEIVYILTEGKNDINSEPFIFKYDLQSNDMNGVTAWLDSIECD